jgi:hypothetical protein
MFGRIGLVAEHGSDRGRDSPVIRLPPAPEPFEGGRARVGREIQREGGMGSLRGWVRVVALAAVVVLVATGCSSDSGGSSTAPPIYDVFAQQFRFHGLPASIPSGNMQINFSNKESFPITHEMILKALPSGDTAQDIIDSAKVPGCEGGGDCETQYLAFGEIAGVDTGATLSNVFDLPSGNYFFACWETGTQSGDANGPPHASKGMVFTFTVT